MWLHPGRDSLLTGFKTCILLFSKRLRDPAIFWGPQNWGGPWQLIRQSILFIVTSQIKLKLYVDCVSVVFFSLCLLLPILDSDGCFLDYMPYTMLNTMGFLFYASTLKFAIQPFCIKSQENKIVNAKFFHYDSFIQFTSVQKIKVRFLKSRTHLLIPRI